jgi:glutaredoxin 3
MTPPVVFYASSLCSSVRQRSEIQKLRTLLEAKKVAYEEKDCSTDTAAREAMVAASGRKTLPQVHVGGKDLGEADTIQEMEDFGELDAALRGEAPPPPPQEQ